MLRTAPSALSALALITVLMGLSVGCCHYPKGRVTQLTGPSAQAPTLTVIAYGDTRTGPLGLGDNAKQAVHGKVVDDVFAQNRNIDAVIFTGDAVMSNFIAWRKDYWRCFLKQAHRFRAHDVPFYPTLGNHEVLPAIVPLIKVTTAIATGFSATQAPPPSDKRSPVARAYDSGEEPKRPVRELEAAPAIQQVDPNNKQGRDVLKQWEKEISENNLDSANKFGQFERHVQGSFYAESVADRCARDAAIFKDDYLKKRDYAYLKQLAQGRSYYSQVLDNGGLRLKLIALDTNCLDSQQQRNFFMQEIKNFDGPIVVFGHHPPVNYNAEGWPWDLVPGWDYYRPYFGEEGKKIVLWIFGHVHDYQRRDLQGADQQVTSPVMLIAGGGGASLDPSAAGFQWQPDSWPAPVVSSAYSHVRLSVTANSILVEVRGTQSETQDFQRIDSFSMPIGGASSH